MMDYIEFDARPVSGGLIPIPEKYRKEIEESEIVHVRLAPVHRTKRLKDDAIQRLLDNPIYIPDFRPPSRDENYER